MKDQPVSGLYRITRKLISTRTAAWLLSRVAHLADRFLLSVTNGRTSFAALTTGLPVISLTTVGARSKQPRTVPLLGIPDGENLILIASNWGQGRHPGWYYNIRANSDVQVAWDGRTKSYTAREVEGAERQQYWKMAVQYYPGYEAYKRWADGREIPVFLLTPA